PGGLIGAQLADLGLRVDDDIRTRWIPCCVILVIGLGFEEGLERHHLGDDRPVEDSSLVQLADVSVGHSLLLIIEIEDRRAVLPAAVGSLTVELRRVMRDREKYLEDLAVAD